MQALSESEFIDWDASLESAVLQRVTGRHLSLLVTKGENIVGILRLMDAFAAIFHMMKQSENTF